MRRHIHFLLFILSVLIGLVYGITFQYSGSYQFNIYLNQIPNILTPDVISRFSGEYRFNVFLNQIPNILVPDVVSGSYRGRYWVIFQGIVIYAPPEPPTPQEPGPSGTWIQYSNIAYVAFLLGLSSIPFILFGWAGLAYTLVILSIYSAFGLIPAWIPALLAIALIAMIFWNRMRESSGE